MSLEPAQTLPQSMRDATLGLVLGDYEHSRQYHETWHKQLKSLYDLYRCIYTGKPLPFKNKVMLPLLFSAVWSDIAFKVQTSVGSVYPFIEFRGEDPADVLSLKRIDAVVNQQLLDAKLFQKLIDMLGSAEIYGTGIFRLSWRHEKRLHKYRQQLMKGLTIEVPDEMTIFDGPDIDVVDLLDLFPAPGYKEIYTAPHLTERKFIDVDDILEMQAGDFPMFNQAAVDELIRTPIASSGQTEYNERTNVYRTMSEYTARRGLKFNKPVEIIERWGLVPKEFAPDGVRMRVITIANRRVILRNEPTPYWSAKLAKPFFKYCPLPDPHFFQGIGKGEIVAKMAAVANKLVSARLDAIELFLAPAFVASEQAGLDGQSLVLWPGRVIKTKAPEVSDAHIRPLSPDLRGYQLVFDEIASVTRYIQQATGVSEDTIQGLVSGARTTAREFLSRAEMGKNRLSLEVLLLEKNVLEPVAEGFRDLDKQYLDFPRIVRRLGVSAVIDQDTGFPIPPDPEPMSVNDINKDCKAYAVGSSQMLGKQMQMQSMIAAGQFAAGIPAAAMTTNWNAFMSRFWRNADLNPAEMIATKIPEANMIAALLGGGARAGGQSAAGSGGGTGMEVLDPTRIGGQSPSNLMPVM